MHIELKRIVEGILNSEDNTGCSEDLTVVSMEPIQKLRDYMVGQDDVIEIRWHIADIMDRAEDRDITLTENEAREILAAILRSHDCNMGINWDVIDTHTDMR